MSDASSPLRVHHELHNMAPKLIHTLAFWRWFLGREWLMLHTGIKQGFRNTLLRLAREPDQVKGVASMYKALKV